MGESAGGLLVAAAMNQRPELFAAVVVDGPFVDVVNTLPDETLPFTVSEWKEWGDPLEPVDLAVLRSYSPYENIRRQLSPNSRLVFDSTIHGSPTGRPRNGPHVSGRRTSKPKVLVKVRLDGGHQGVSDRFEEVQEWAMIYAFIIRQRGGWDARSSPPKFMCGIAGISRLEGTPLPGTDGPLLRR